jgi:hypothetical protein
MTLQEAKLFIRNYKNFIEVFGEDIFEIALANYDVTDFSTHKYVPLNEGRDAYYEKMGYPVLIDNTIWHFKEYNGIWEREVTKPAKQYRVPDDYQLREKDLLKDCIILVNPNMANYEMSIYHLDKPTDDIYIKCDDSRSLYVPVKAIVEKNFNLVIDRHTTYHKGYYNTIDRKEYLDAALATLETETAKALRKTIEENAPYTRKIIEDKPKVLSRTIRVSFDVVLDGTDEAIQEKVKKKLKYSTFSDPTNITIEEV